LEASLSNILVSGLINLETTLQVDYFPIEYFPVCYPFFGVRSSVSGVGFNLAKALTVLGDTPRFLSLVGMDAPGKLIHQALDTDQINAEYILPELVQTPQSVILHDRNGRRQIHVDLKDIQEKIYPQDRFCQALEGCQIALLCNINFSRPMLSMAKRAGKIVATDVHAIADLEDQYNRDFMAAADILFMSDENLPHKPEDWAQQIFRRYSAEIVVIGLGAQGALIGVRSDRFLERIPAVTTRPVVNTIGAGDALFSAFIHAYLQTGDPYISIRQAVVFASYKVGESGAADGFLDASGLEQLFRERS
jgi:acarbose 7IV-phosphotransferase